MKDSGVPWIGEIPKGWECLLLKRICTHITDGSHFSPETTTEGKPYITVSDVFNGIVHDDNAARISDADYEILVKNGCKPPKNSVLLSKDGTVGRTAIVRNNDYVVLSSLGILTPNDDLDSRYLKFLLDSPSLQEQMQLAMAGSALRRITIAKINTLIGLRPSHNEQQRIADFLDTNCAEIDSILEKTKASIEEYKKLKQSVITEAVTKGIRGERPMKDSGVEWIGEIPTEWRASKLKYVANTQGRIGFKGYTSADLVGEGEGALTIGGKHIGRNLLDLTDPDFISWEKYYESPEIMVAKGDLLIAQRGSVGKVALVNREIGEATINPSLVLIRCHSMNEKLLYYNLIADFTQKEIGLLNTATAVPMISQWQINNLHIITPPLPEQQEIVTYLDEKCAAIDSLIASKEALITELEAYKKSIIYEYVTGKKEVPVV